MSFDPQRYLESLGGMPEGDIDVGLAALALSAALQPGVPVDRFVHHLERIRSDVRVRHAALIREGAQDDAPARLAALKHVLAIMHGYEGDCTDPGSPENANLERVIDRRKGGGAALGILYIDAARAQGWEVAGLDFPGRFLCRLDKDGQRIVFDPCAGCCVLEAHDLRERIKASKGKNAELSAQYFMPISNRALLLCLLNPLKFRQIENEEYADAVQTVEVLRRAVPEEYRLVLEVGVLLARTGQREEAIRALEEYIRLCPGGRERQEAALLLRELQENRK